MIKNLLWCSVHQPTVDQLRELDGVGNLMFLKTEFPELQEKLNNTPGNIEDLIKLTIQILAISDEQGIYAFVQMGGSLKFQYLLGQISNEYGYAVKSLYAHSERKSVDQIQLDGTVVKTSVFKHIAFI